MNEIRDLGDWSGYLRILLFEDYNLPLTLSVLMGALLGLWRRMRWVVTLSLLVAGTVILLTIGDRLPQNRYLMIIMPALWLLASYAVVLVGRRPKWIAAGIGAVVVMPFIGIVRLDWE